MKEVLIMKREIAEALLGIEAVFLRPEEPFTWASGIKSPVYCDNRLILTSPEARNLVENAIADTVRDTVFTTEYSVRTAMEAVYTLLNVDRGVPEVFGSCYDIRVLLDSTSKMMDGKKLTDIKLPLSASIAQKTMMKKVSGTVIEELLKKYNLI